MPKFICAVAVTLCFVLSSPIGAQAPILPRVRISVGSVVEMVGVVRLEGGTITGAVVASDGGTVTVRGAGLEAMTLPRPRRKIVGVVETVASDAVTVVRADGSKIVVPRGAIAKVERVNGRRSRARGAGLGFLIGAGGGAGVGYLIGASCHPTGFLGCFLQPWGSAFAGIIIGGGAGALIGALTQPRERWIAVSADWLDTRVGSGAGTAFKAQVPR